MAPPISLTHAKVPEYVNCIRQAMAYNDTAHDMLADIAAQLVDKNMKLGLTAVTTTWGSGLERITQMLGQLGPYALKASRFLEAVDDNGKQIVLQAKES